MNDLIIEGIKKTFFTPSVEFIVSTGKCSIEGEAYLEDPLNFFQPLYDWMYEYMEKIKKPIVFEIRLSYFNTSAARCVYDMLFILKEYIDKGGEVTVSWYYDEDDEDMLLEIDDYLRDTGLEIARIPN